MTHAGRLVDQCMELIVNRHRYESAIFKKKWQGKRFAVATDGHVIVYRKFREGERRSTFPKAPYRKNVFGVWNKIMALRPAPAFRRVEPWSLFLPEVPSWPSEDGAIHPRQFIRIHECHAAFFWGVFQPLLMLPDLKLQSTQTKGVRGHGLGFKFSEGFGCIMPTTTDIDRLLDENGA